VIEGMIDLAEGISQWSKLFDCEQNQIQELMAEFLSVSQDLAHFQRDAQHPEYLVQYLQSDLPRFLEEVKLHGISILRNGALRLTNA
jgi:hypothetical protein